MHFCGSIIELHNLNIAIIIYDILKYNCKIHRE